jgi:hypothetical protein
MLARQWLQLGLINPGRDFTDAEAMAAIIRITRGNFRLLHRLCTKIQPSRPWQPAMDMIACHTPAARNTAVSR